MSSLSQVWMVTRLESYREKHLDTAITQDHLNGVYGGALGCGCRRSYSALSRSYVSKRTRAAKRYPEESRD